MCEFLSWIKRGNKIYFLTYDMIYNTPRGEILRKQFDSDNPDDFYGHEAIRKYFELSSGIGTEEECTDFSTPNNFPTVIVTAIKAGKLKGLARPKQLLTHKAWAEYEKIEQTAWAEYKKIKQTALTEYKKIEQPAWAEYEKIERPAWAEYKKIKQTAWAEYKKIKQTAFWDLFADTKNRNINWR